MTEKEITLLATPDMRLLMGARFDHPGNMGKTFWKDLLTQASTLGGKRQILFCSLPGNLEIYNCNKLNSKKISSLVKKLKIAKMVVFLENDCSKYTPRFKEHEEIVELRPQPTTIVDFVNKNPKLNYLDTVSGKKS